MNLTFSVNQYDSDGELFDNCILIHHDTGAILRLKDMLELNKYIEDLHRVKLEVEENH